MPCRSRGVDVVSQSEHVLERRSLQRNRLEYDRTHHPPDHSIGVDNGAALARLHLLNQTDSCH